MIEFKSLDEAERRMAEIKDAASHRKESLTGAGVLQPVVQAIQLCLSEIRELKSQSQPALAPTELDNVELRASLLVCQARSAAIELTLRECVPTWTAHIPVMRQREVDLRQRFLEQLEGEQPALAARIHQLLEDLSEHGRTGSDEGECGDTQP